MKRKQKLWVIVTLACFFIGASFWLLTPSSVSKVSANNASKSASEGSPSRITLHVSGRYDQLPLEDHAYLPQTLPALTSGTARPAALPQADITHDGAPDLIGVYNTNHGSELRVRLNTIDGNMDALLPQSFEIGAASVKAFA